VSVRSKAKRKAQRALTSPAPWRVSYLDSALFRDRMKSKDAYTCRNCGLRLAQHIRLKCPFDHTQFQGSHA
jgi:lipopolysaccharide biosynthesis regulator YciM